MGVKLPAAIQTSSKPVAGKALALGLNGKIDPSVLPTVAAARETLFDTTLTGNSASIAVTSIPGTFSQLMLVCYLRTDRGGGNFVDGVVVQYNGDGVNANYLSLDMEANGSGFATNSSSGTASAGLYAGLSAAAAGTAGSFGTLTVLIPNYSATVGQKISSFWGGEADTSLTDIYIVSGVGRWGGTAAITSITLLPYLGANFVTGSRVTLYGLA